MPEEELPVQIAQVDGIKIDDMNLTEASEDKILEKFASNTSSADKKNPRLSINKVSQID